MSLWRVLLKQIASKPFVNGMELYDERISPQATWQALDWLQAHRLVKSRGLPGTGWYCATVLGEHVAKGRVPIVRRNRGNKTFLRMPSGQMKWLPFHVDPQPSLETKHEQDTRPAVDCAAQAPRHDQHGLAANRPFDVLVEACT